MVRKTRGEAFFALVVGPGPRLKGDKGHLAAVFTLLGELLGEEVRDVLGGGYVVRGHNRDLRGLGVGAGVYVDHRDALGESQVRYLIEHLRVRRGEDKAVYALGDVVRKQVVLTDDVGLLVDPIPLHVHFLVLGGRALSTQAYLLPEVESQGFGDDSDLYRPLLLARLRAHVGLPRLTGGRQCKYASHEDQSEGLTHRAYPEDAAMRRRRN